MVGYSKLKQKFHHFHKCTGDDSDSNMEEDSWSNHKGLALLAGLSAQHGSGSSTPVKGSHNSTPGKPKKVCPPGSSKQSEKTGGTSTEGSGTESIKKKSKSKKRSSSKGSADGMYRTIVEMAYSQV